MEVVRLVRSDWNERAEVGCARILFAGNRPPQALRWGDRFFLCDEATREFVEVDGVHAVLPEDIELAE